VERVRGKTPVGIVAVNGEGKVILISQFRIPVDKRCVEIPAGLTGDGEDVEEGFEKAAVRELEEETGYTAEKMEFLTEGATSAGLTSERIMLVRAVGVKKIGAPRPDGDEDIAVHEVALEDADSFLRQREAAGELVDPKVWAALYFLTRNR
jgi:ADP-ribose pyrophosphatase